MTLKILLLATALILLGGSAAWGEVPWTITYQGYLTDAAGVPVSGVQSVRFSLYAAASGGTALWSEVQSVTVTNGVFGVVLGSVTPIALPFDSQYFLGVQIGSEAEMAPRHALTSVPYAIRSATTEAVAEGAVTAAKIQDGAITPDKLAAMCAEGEILVVRAGAWTCEAVP